MHREARYLRRIFKQLTRLVRDVKHLTILIAADRPSARVAIECERFQRNVGPRVEVRIWESPQVFTSEGVNWMAPIAAAYSELRATRGCLHAAILWDDDMLLSPPLLRELRGHLGCLEYDRLEAESLFLWDTPEQFNATFPTHWSTILFKVRPGDFFPLNYITHSPDGVARSSSYLQLENSILNYGYIDPETRPLQWTRARENGMIDGHTLALVKPPKLRSLREI